MRFRILVLTFVSSKQVLLLELTFPWEKTVRGRSTNKEGSNTWSILMSAGVMGGRPGVNPLSWAAMGSREQSLHYTLRLLGTTG